MDTKQCFVNYALQNITCTLLIMLLFHCRYTEVIAWPCRDTNFIVEC